LIKALRNLDEGPYSTYVELHLLVPALGPARDRIYFRDHQEEEIRAAEKWWGDEVARQPATRPTE
jgi:hypothetical protein